MPNAFRLPETRPANDVFPCSARDGLRRIQRYPAPHVQIVFASVVGRSLTSSTSLQTHLDKCPPCPDTSTQKRACLLQRQTRSTPERHSSLRILPGSP